MRPLLFALSTLLAVLASGVLVETAAAQPQRVDARRVVVQRFRGPRGSQARRQLVSDLEDNGIVVIDDDEVRAQREQLGYPRNLSSDDQYVELARALNASAFIDGRVARRRRRWALTVRVRNGFDGAELGDESWGGRTAASLSAVGRTGYQRLSGYLDTSASPSAPPAPVVPEGETPWYARQDEIDETPPEEEAPEEEAAPSAADYRYDAFRVFVGGGTLFRAMDTTVTVYASQRRRMPVNPAVELLDESRRYQSGGIGHFELGGQVELYPGAFDDQAFPYLGALVAFSHSIGVQSNGLNRLTGEPLAVPTNQLDFLVAARFRYRFGDAPEAEAGFARAVGPHRREPELYIDAGWGTFQFNLGLAELQQIEPDTVIPPMSSGYMHLAAGIRYGVVPTYLTLGLEVAGRIGTNVGADTRNVWGIDTGPSNGFAIAAEARVEIPEVVQGFFLALRLMYFQMITSFAGQVGCANPDDCAYQDPWDDERYWEVWPVEAPPAGSAANLDAVIGGPQSTVTDHYFRLQLQVGYAFR